MSKSISAVSNPVTVPRPPQHELPRLTRQTRVGQRAFASVAENDARNDPSGWEIRAALEQMVASDSFRTCPRLAAFLRFVTEATLRGESAHLKGYTIAVEALGRNEDFDPQRDPIVRVEAGRLRRVIQHYYAGPGAKDLLVIDVPRGRYIPTFRYRRAKQALPIPSSLGNGFLVTGDTGTAVTRVDEVNTIGARRWDGDTSPDMTPTHFPGYDFLRPRERKVLTQIAAGASSKEAGRQLGISFRTIEIHRARIMEKLDLVALLTRVCPINGGTTALNRTMGRWSRLCIGKNEEDRL